MARFDRVPMDDILHGPRARLYDLILARPGIRFTDLVAATNSHFGATAHHLFVLERFQLVRSYKTNRSRRYVAALGPDEETRRAAVLSEPNAREMFDLVLTRPGLSQTELARHLPDVSRQTVAYRLAQLMRLRLVSEVRLGRWKAYRATGNAIARALPASVGDSPIPAGPASIAVLDPDFPDPRRPVPPTPPIPPSKPTADLSAWVADSA